MPHPLLRISRRAADRLRAGYLWVYRSDTDAMDSEPQPGALVTVEDARGAPLGTGLYSTHSKIAARMVSPEPGLSRAKYLIELGERLQAALARREAFAPVTADNDAQRLVFAEADNLPGIVADRYRDVVVLQLLTQGTAQDDVRSVFAETLRGVLAPDAQPLTVWERPDPRVRELEHLPPPPAGPLFSNAFPAAPPATTTFTLNGLRFGYDASAGQKTGAFLDQRLNYAAAARHIAASGRTARALDICTYQGGFALHLARVCGRVTGVDQSRTALETADRNLALNPTLPADVEWIEADAFALLRALDEVNRTQHTANDLPLDPGPFDAIVLDPPAFAKSKRAIEGALRGYKELNLRALRLLAPGGTLVTCSCSHHVSLQAFTEVLSAAAADAGRRVQLLESRGAAPDHPEILTLPETRYLKCLICRVD